MANIIVKLDRINKIFKTNNTNFYALKNVSLNIIEGEVVSFIGPSGSGKTTCLRVINALETISSGSVLIANQSYNDNKLKIHDIRKNTAMIFQRFELFPHLKVIDNVAIGPKLILQKTKLEAQNIAEILLSKLGLKEHLYKYPRALSGGQQQRVAIARALALNPKILLCDEPTSALDPELVDEILDILTDIAKSGMTMIVVTHELSFAQKISNRTIFFNNGEIVEEGKSDELFINPQSQRLQNFLSKIHT